MGADDMLSLERKGLIHGLAPGQSLCWDCGKACGGKGCPWADSLTPNPEWRKTETRGGLLVVKDCGSFQPDYSRPFDARAIRRMLSPGADAVLMRKADLSRLALARLQRLLNAYNKIREEVSLPRIVMRPPEEEEEEDETYEE